ncbi:hypothetical protein LguiB_013728 [Lonicera macranthoides]
MATLNDPNETISFSFSDFPEDVQLCILSFLCPSEISSFACTSKRFVSLCRNDGKLWFSMCDRKWGSKTHIKKWDNGKITYKQLYKTLSEFDNLIGFWHGSGQGNNAGFHSPPLLLFFEWGPSFISGSRVSPTKSGNYSIVKAPFMWMSITTSGEKVSFLDPECRLELNEDFGELGFSENELVPINVSFIGKCHVVVEENSSFRQFNSPEGKKSGMRRISSGGNMRGEEYGDVDDNESEWRQDFEEAEEEGEGEAGEKEVGA